MAVGKYTLPICDGCTLPWLPVGWTQDSDPRNLREGAKPLRCGKCKSIGWDREYMKAQKATEGNVAQSEEQRGAIVTMVAGSSPAVSTNTPQDDAVKAVDDYLEKRGVTRVRCKHRMTDCPICHPKEAA